MPSLCRTKHNRAKPMSELPAALFLIADGNEFRFARFYIVCEEVPLGTPESPPIVSGVSDMHPSDCPNVEETRNPMQTFSRKKCSHFFPTNIPSAFPHEIPKCVSYNITYSTQSTICLLRQFLLLQRSGSAPPPFYFAPSHATVSRMMWILSI